MGQSRYWNIKSIGRYIESIRQGKSPVEEKEILTREQQMIEVVFLGLRTSDGVDIREFDRRFNVSFYRLFSEIIDRLKSQQRIETTESRCFLSPKGLPVSDAVAGCFADCL